MRTSSQRRLAAFLTTLLTALATKGIQAVALAGEAVAPPVLPEEARFYSEAFEPLFANSATLLQVAHLCKERFPKECGVSVQENVPELEDTLRMFSLITAFSPSKSSVKLDSRKFASADDMYDAMSELSEGVLANLLAYDKDLMARYRAVIARCPEDLVGVDKLLALMTRKDLERFSGLSSDASALAQKEIDAKYSRYLGVVKAWSDDRCVRTRQFGRTLIKALIVRLKPYEKEGWQNLSRHNRDQYGGEFIWRATMAFETTVQPDIASKIEAASR